MVSELMVKAWKEAEEDLGCIVVAPYLLQLSDGAEIEFEVYLPDFGGSKGALLVALDDAEKYKVATNNGYFCSQLNSDVYSVYNRKEFIDSLNDIGWYGVGEMPDWYTGKAWS